MGALASELVLMRIVMSRKRIIEKWRDNERGGDRMTNIKKWFERDFFTLFDYLFELQKARFFCYFFAGLWFGVTCLHETMITDVQEIMRPGEGPHFTQRVAPAKSCSI